MKHNRTIVCGLALFTAALPARALHVGEHPSVHDTVAAIKERLRRELPPRELAALSLDRALEQLTVQERRVLGAEHISFRVSVPVNVWVITNRKLAPEPFWLRDQQYRRTNLEAAVGTEHYEVWEKQFPAGRIGLGVNSLAGGATHYFVALQPQDKEAQLRVEEIYPGQHRLDVLAIGAKVYVDRSDPVVRVPPELTGSTLLRTQHSRRDDARLLNLYRVTEYPASQQPDQLVLTWSDDPCTTQTIQWRTSTKVKSGCVQYVRKRQAGDVDSSSWRQVDALTEVLTTPETVNDPMVHRHTAVLRGLEPDTAYSYRVGAAIGAAWTQPAEFTTAPSSVRPFSFIYMGDAQNGLDQWGRLVHGAHRLRPDVAFYMMAGDLVNRGAERDDWDSLFANAAGVYDRRALIPAIGNHECQGGQPTLYLKLFSLPENGPAALAPERAYAFKYSNALFVILDSNVPPESQAEWLDQQLRRSRAAWKFVMYHHPAYSSHSARDNKSIRDVWVPIFDRHHVDMVLQGHDHAYLRTYPMHGNQRVASPREGTIYVVSVSGTKMYPQAERYYTEVGFTNTATFQVLDIHIVGDRLHYRAYDAAGTVRDEFVIDK